MKVVRRSANEDDARHTSAGPETEVIDLEISESNLLVLLAKLYQPGSNCTLYNDRVYDGDLLTPEGEVCLKIHSVHDVDHVEEVPTPMHPETIELVEKLRQVLEAHRRPLTPQEELGTSTNGSF